jgi:hypothetical protein
MTKRFNFYLFIIVLGAILNITSGCAKSQKHKVCLVISDSPTLLETYAAREVRRYLYLRTGILVPILRDDLNRIPKDKDLIVIGSSSSKLLIEVMKNNKLTDPTLSLKEQSFWLKTIKHKNQTMLIVLGKDDPGTLRGAYKLMESYGIRYTLNEDIIPDELTNLILPSIDLIANPVFDIRGNFPYFCNPEGPDNWNANAFKAFITQQTKLGMNFIGLRNDWAMMHLWKGIPEDLNEDGSLKFAYKTWLESVSDISFAPFGAGMAFKNDVFANDNWLEFRNKPEKMEKLLLIHESNGQILKEAFSFARKLGVYTCVGSELPITNGVPKEVADHMKQITGKDVIDLEKEIYQGTFKRTMKVLDPDFYWLNTNERWIWDKPENIEKDITSAVNSFKTAIEVKNDLGSRFKLATMGWVVGPKTDRLLLDRELPKDIIISALNEDVGKKPIDPTFERIENRTKWVIPWMESDFDLLSPQLWVGRSIQNTLDAEKYGCTGLIGIHWRTKILTPQMQALAYLGWYGNLNLKAFYDDFAISNFGKQVASEISSIFQKMDSNLPSASDWKNGPGGIYADSSYWEKEKSNFRFVDDLEKIRPRVKGAANLERFDYYLNQYRYLRSLGKLKSSLGTPNEDKDLRDALTYLIESSYTTGELGNIANIVNQMAKGKPQDYTGKPHLIVLTPRTSLEPDEDLELDVMFIDNNDPHQVTLHWREIGEKRYKELDGLRKERNHFSLKLSSSEIDGRDIEYYVKGITSSNEEILFPRSAKNQGLTIIQLTTNIPRKYLLSKK